MTARAMGLLRGVRERGVGVAFGLLILAGFAAAMGLRPLLWPQGLSFADTERVLAFPSLRHPFGTDADGRDVLVRVIDGARYAFIVPLASLAVGIGLGAPIGLAAGLSGGWLDRLLRRLLQGVGLVPPLLLAMALVAAMGPSLRHVVVAIGLLQAVVFARAMRDQVRAMHDRGFIEGARAIGSPMPRMILLHLLPNTLAQMAGEIPRQAAWALGVLAAMGFVGIATAASSTEWGSMIREATEHLLAGQWWAAIFPGLALLLFGIALHTMAASLDERLLLRGAPGSERRPGGGAGGRG
jgi:peptide/nickel transport system permease protein